MKIMLVEDDSNMRSLLHMLLELDGHTILPYDENYNIDDILFSFENDLPDLLLMDVHLHNTDGIELLRQIRKTISNSQMRIIMTSGMNLTQECLDAGADDFLLKPYIPDDLLKMLPSEKV